MAERIKPSEKPKNEPFEIRGHHLLNIINFSISGKPPEEYAQTERQRFENFRKESRKVAPEPKKDEFDIYSMLSPKNRTIPEIYYNDLMGTTKEKGDRFEKNLSDIFKTFKELPDNAKIRLTAGKPDEICKACTGAKEHCSLKNMKKFNGSEDAVHTDYLDVDLFLKASEESSPFRSFRHIREEVAFSDSRPMELSTYEMSLKEFKRTVTYMQSHPEKYAVLIWGKIQEK